MFFPYYDYNLFIINESGGIALSEINKERFGKLIAECRKRKGYTQQELAERLLVSNKAVSKWETGNSLPDISLLLPISEVLEIKISELLQAEEFEQMADFQDGQMELLIKKAASFKEDSPEMKHRKKRTCILVFCMSITFLILEILIFRFLHIKFFGLPVIYVFLTFLSMAFGVNVWLVLDDELPKYYNDHTSLSGPPGFRKEPMGVRVTRKNYPKLIKTVRIWSVVTMLCMPILGCLENCYLPESMNVFYLQGVFILLYFGSLIITTIIMGERYE